MPVRRVKEQDIPRILELLAQVNKLHHDGRPDLFRLGTKYGKEDLISMLSDEDMPIFVCTDEDGYLLGYGFCQILSHDGERLLTDFKNLYIDDICVDEAYRGKHVGSQIYAHIRQYAKSIGCHNITLNVWNVNPIARKFYESLGMGVQKTTMEEVL